MNTTTKRLLLPIFFSALLPGMAHAAASNSIEEVENKIKDMTQLIESYIDKLEYPANEFMRIRLAVAENFEIDATKPSLLQAKASFLEDTVDVIDTLKQKDASIDHQTSFPQMYKHVLIQSRSAIRSEFKQLSPSFLDIQARPLTLEQLIERTPDPKAITQEFLQELLNSIEQQKTIMQLIDEISIVLSDQITLSEKIEGMYIENTKFHSQLMHMDSSDPNIIAIKLKKQI